MGIGVRKEREEVGRILQLNLMSLAEVKEINVERFKFVAGVFKVFSDGTREGPSPIVPSFGHLHDNPILCGLEFFVRELIDVFTKEKACSVSSKFSFVPPVRGNRSQESKSEQRPPTTSKNQEKNQERDCKDLWESISKNIKDRMLLKIHDVTSFMRDCLKSSHRILVHETCWSVDGCSNGGDVPVKPWIENGNNPVQSLHQPGRVLVFDLNVGIL
jgi:hypothetical protein